MDKEPTEKLDPTGNFTESGNCDDEITLDFDCNKKLYVSRNFLRYASPVFEAMFNNDFIEKRQNYVKLTGKNYEDFIEFLLCIHSRIWKSVTDSNVLRIASIAEEYQVTSIKETCKERMLSIFSRSIEKARPHLHYLHHVEPLRVCIRIIATAEQLNYDDIVETGVSTIARFGQFLYSRNQPTPNVMYVKAPASDTKIENETLDQIHQDCIKLFEQLSVEIRCRIFTERLKFWNDSALK